MRFLLIMVDVLALIEDHSTYSSVQNYLEFEPTSRSKARVWIAIELTCEFD